MRLYVTGFDKGDNWSPITYETKDMVSLQRDNLAGRGIFYSVNSFDATKEELAKAGFATKRNKPFLKELWYCFGDLDICKEGDDTTVDQREAKKQTMIDALMDHCEPTLIVATKNGVQPLWKLRNSEITPEYLDKYESAEMGIIKWSIQHGGKGDEVKDTTRVLRMPGFYHQKGEEKYIVKTVYSSDVTYTIEELMELFPYEKSVKTYDQKTSDRDADHRLDQLDFRHIIKHAFHSVGKTCEFDEKGEVVINGRVTGNFQGKTGDRRFIAGQSHEDFRGNVITATGKIIGKNDKETFEWILREFGLWEEELPSPQIPKSMCRKITDQIRSHINWFTWGTEELDLNFATIERSSLIFIVGEKGKGKTTYTFDQAIKNAELGHQVCFLELEMTVEELIEQVARGYAGITNSERFRLKQGVPLPSHKQKKFDDRCAEIRAVKNLTIVAPPKGPQITWSQAEQLMKQVKPEGFDLVYLDHWNRILADTDTYQSQIDKLNNILNFITKNNTPVIALHHFRKGVKGASHFFRDLDEMDGVGAIGSLANYIIQLQRTPITLPKKGEIAEDKRTDEEKARLFVYLQKARGGSECLRHIYHCDGSFFDQFRSAYTPTIPKPGYKSAYAYNSLR